jgi:hypothetical protein
MHPSNRLGRRAQAAFPARQIESVEHSVAATRFAFYRAWP